MIVTLHVSMSNRYKQIDPDMRIQAESIPFGQTEVIKIKGDQLLIAGIHTTIRDGRRIEPDRYYYLHPRDVVPCHIKPTAEWTKHRNVDTGYVFQVKGWSKDGLPAVCVWDLICATDSLECLAYYSSEFPGCVLIQSDCYEAC